MSSKGLMVDADGSDMAVGSLPHMVLGMPWGPILGVNLLCNPIEPLVSLIEGNAAGSGPVLGSIVQVERLSFPPV